MNMFLKSILTNSRLEINKIEKELIDALVLYLTKKDLIVQLHQREEGLEYKIWIILTKIIK